LLRAWTPKLNQSYIIDYLRGVGLWDDDKLDSAEHYLSKSVQHGDATFDAVAALARLRFKRLPAESVSSLAPLAVVTDFASAHPADPAPYLFYGEQFRDRYHAPAWAWRAFLKAFSLEPSAEAMNDAVNAAWGTRGDTILVVLKHALRILPQNQVLESDLARATVEFSDDTVEAYRLFRAAINHSVTERDRVDNVVAFARNFYDALLFNYSKANEILESQLRKTKNSRRTILFALYTERLTAGDFPASLRYLRMIHDGGNTSQSWYQERVFDLERYMRADSAKLKHQTEYPDADRWRNELGGSVSLRIRFQENSSQPDKSDLDRLRHAVKVLAGTADTSYVIAVEGHSDSAEADPTELSLRRASAIAQFMELELRVPADRISTAEYGAGLPFAPSASQFDRKLNRIVEVRLLGSAAAPQLLVPRAMTNGQSVSLSPDGRLVATGYEPIQIWDVHRRAFLRTLVGIGGGTPRAFSPDGRYLAVASRNRENDDELADALVVYDVQDGVAVVQEPLSYDVQGLAWSPNGKQLAFATGDGKLTILDMKARLPIRRVRLGIKRIGARLLWTHDGAYILSAQGRDTIVRIWNASTLTPDTALGGVNWVHALGETRDGNLIVAADNDRILSVWNRRTWQRRQIKIAPLANSLTVDPARHWVVISDFGCEFACSPTALVDLDSLTVRATKFGMPEAQVAYSPDGHYVYADSLAHLLVLDGASLQKLEEFPTNASSAIGAVADTADDRLLTLDQDRMSVWDIRTGQRLFATRNRMDVVVQIRGLPSEFVAVHRDSISRHTEVTLFDSRDLRQRSLMTLPYYVDRIASTRALIAFAGEPFKKGAIASETGILESYNRLTLDRVSHAIVRLRTGVLEYDSVYKAGFTGFDLSPDGKLAVVTTYWQDGFGHDITLSSEARVVDLGLGRIRQVIAPGSEVTNAEFEGSGAIAVHTAHAVFSYDIARATYSLTREVSGEQSVTELRSSPESILWSGIGVRVLTKGALEAREVAPIGEHIAGIGVFERQNLVLLVTQGNQILFYDLSGLVKRLIIAPRRSGEWIAFTPNGAFTASPQGASGVSWLVGDRLLPFEALRNHFERPDIVAAMLDSIAERSVHLSAETPPALRPAFFTKLFEVAVLAKAQMSTSDSTVVLPVRLTKTAANAAKWELVVARFGTDSTGALRADTMLRTGFDAAKDSLSSLVISIPVPILLGQNMIEVGLDVAGGVLLSQTILVQRSRDQVGPGVAIPTRGASRLPSGWRDASINGHSVRILSEPKLGDIRVMSDTFGLFREGVNYIETKVHASKQTLTYWYESGQLLPFHRPYKHPYAVIVAIGDYARRASRMGATGYAVIDSMVPQAKRLAQVLIAEGVPPQNVIQIYDQGATLDSIDKVLRTFYQGGPRSNADRLFFYFGGHGDVFDGSGFLVTYDFDRKEKTTHSLLMEDLTNRYSTLIAAKDVLFAIDACHSGLTVTNLGGAEDTRTIAGFRALTTIQANDSGRARNVLLAGTGNDQAIYHGGGIFTQALISGLSHDADLNHDGVIELLELATYVRQTVTYNAKIQGQVQRPDFAILRRYGDGEVTFLTPGPHTVN